MVTRVLFSPEDSSEEKPLEPFKVFKVIILGLY